MKEPLTVCYGPFMLNLVSGNAYLNGELFPLAHREFSLLVGFIERPGEIISAQYILTSFWEVQANIDLSALKTRISRLRKRLHESNSGYTVKAVRYKGYCFQKLNMEDI